MNINFKIKNFKSLEDIDLNIKPLTLLFGPNGSGKSSVLKLLSFVNENVINFTKGVKTKFQVSNSVLASPSTINLGDYKSIVTNNDKSRTIELQLKLQCPISEYSYITEIALEIDPSMVETEFDIDMSEKKKVSFPDSALQIVHLLNDAGYLNTNEYVKNLTERICDGNQHLISNLMTTYFQNYEFIFTVQFEDDENGFHLKKINLEDNETKKMIVFLFNQNRITNISISKRQKDKVKELFSINDEQYKHDLPYLFDDDEPSLEKSIRDNIIEIIKINNKVEIEEKRSIEAETKGIHNHILDNEVIKKIVIKEYLQFKKFFNRFPKAIDNLVNFYHFSKTRELPKMYYDLVLYDKRQDKEIPIKNLNKNYLIDFAQLYDLPIDKKKSRVDIIRQIYKLTKNKASVQFARFPISEYYGLLESFYYKDEIDKRYNYSSYDPDDHYWHEIISLLSKLELAKSLYKEKDLKNLIGKVKIQHNNGSITDLRDASSGLLQILPIVLRGFIHKGFNLFFLQKPNFFLEQPELHLHPKLQSQLATIFLEQIKVSKNHYLIETHSEHLIRKIQVYIANGELNKDQINVYYFDNKSGITQLKEMNFEDNGFFTTPWPDGFFDESFNLTEQLLSATKRN